MLIILVLPEYIKLYINMVDICNNSVYKFVQVHFTKKMLIDDRRTVRLWIDRQGTGCCVYVYVDEVKMWCVHIQVDLGMV